MRILIIDHNEGDRQTIRQGLDEAPWNLDVEDAASAQDAADLIAANDYDCVFLDYQLPGMNGVDFYQMVIRDSGAEMPVIMVAENGTEEIAVKAIKSGIVDYIPKRNLAPERIEAAMVAAIDYAGHLRIAKLKEQAQEKLILRDHISGLPGLNSFEDRLETSFANSKRNGTDYALMVMELVGYDEVEKEYGHKACEAVLTAIGARCKEVLRSSDAAFRLDGERFAIIVGSGVSREGLSLLAGKISKAFSMPVDFLRFHLEVEVRGGIALRTDATDTPEALLNSAKAAMKEAFETGAGFAWAESSIEANRKASA